MAPIKKWMMAAALGVLGLALGRAVMASTPSVGAQVFTVYSAASATCGGKPCIWADSTPGKIKFRDSTGVDKLVGEMDRVTTAASDPGTPVAGQCYYNTGTGKIRCYQNAAWVNWGDGGTPGSVTFTQVQTALGAATGAVSLNSQNLTSVNLAAVTSLTIAGAPAEATWSRTCTLTSAAATTPVTCLADADVPTGKKAYLLGWRAKVNGATAWATTSTVYIADSSGTGGTGIVYVAIGVAALTGNAFVQDASANVTQQNAYALNTGGTATKGIVIEGDANGTGSNLVVTLFGSTK